MEQTKHGYKIYPAGYNFEKHDRIFCKDDADALEDIRELLMQGRTFEVVNMYDTFYGCGWGHWLIEGTKDIATAKIIDTWNPGYYCAKPFPYKILLRPKKS